MSNVCFYEKLNSLVPELTLLQFNFTVGSTGAVGATMGNGITSITRLGAGVYRILLDSKYDRLIDFKATTQAPLTGSAIAAGSLNPTTIYRITALGTSDFTLVGARINAVGEAFVASATTAGTGTATAIAAGQVQSFQLCNSIVDDLQDIVFQCADDAGAVIEMEETCKIFGHILLRRSNIEGKGE